MTPLSAFPTRVARPRLVALRLTLVASVALAAVGIEPVCSMSATVNRPAVQVAPEGWPLWSATPPIHRDDARVA